MFRVFCEKAIEDQQANRGGVIAGSKEIINGAMKVLISAQLYDHNLIHRKEYDIGINLYDNRILDALARLFYVSDSTADGKGKAVCSAVSVVKTDTGVLLCYLSYNCSTDSKMEREIKDIFKIIKESAPTKNPHQLVQYCIEKTHKFYFPSIVSKDQMQNLQDFLDSNNITDSKLVSFIKNKKEVLEVESDYRDLCNVYSEMNGFDAISTLLENTKDRIIDLRNRLYQDCHKIIVNFNRSCLKNLQVEDITFLPNPDKIHCELNIREKLKSQQLFLQYIGVSKLSCLVCDIVINSDEVYTKSILHAGTHGIAYPIDKLPLSVTEDKEMSLLKGILDKTRTILPIDTAVEAYEIDSTRQYSSLSPIDERIESVELQDRLDDQHNKIIKLSNALENCVSNEEQPYYLYLAFELAKAELIGIYQEIEHSHGYF